MYQLLIVDDEEWVVDGVAATLPCEELQIDHIYKAGSAAEAQDILKRYAIDLLITDIRMPGMSGLELMEEISRSSKSTKCILLTGYAEFEYAKQALKTGAADYLLKPVDDEDLITSVKQALQDIQQEWETVVSHEHTVQTLREHRPLLQRDLLLELLQGRLAAGSQLSSKLSSLDIPFQEQDSVALMLIRLEEPFVHYSHSDLLLLEYAVHNIAEEVLRGRMNLWFGKESHGYLVFVVKPVLEENAVSDIKQDLERLAGQIQKHVAAYLKGSISLMISKWGVFPDHVHTAYESGLISFRKHIGSSTGFLLSMQDEPHTVPVRTLQQLYEPPLLTDLLEAGRWDCFSEKLESIFEELEENFSHSAEHALEVYCSVIGAFAFMAHKSGYELYGWLGNRLEDPLRFDDFRTLSQLKDWTFRTAAIVRSELESEASNTQTRTVKKIHKFVEEHLSESLSLQRIADHVYLHPVYVSQVFKAVSGESLTDYILRVRMERAAYLLRSSPKKIYEVAELLGYQHVPYFIKVFKKYYGSTPQEFRDVYDL
ncbi:response regulator [Paenibacillus lemnae]|uniref:Response regulator n=1 Tax=Paenibacillus lemnae TaxID=1330551 RepID=A0A848M394_PAELE|nr:response regulator [Paenibacillus lemnae]NMO94711.1 response regulator [Paenibacillus lemnae]